MITVVEAQHLIRKPVALTLTLGLSAPEAQPTLPPLAYTVLLAGQRDPSENGVYDLGFAGERGELAVLSRSGSWLFEHVFVGGETRRWRSRSGRRLYGTPVFFTDRANDKLARRRIRSLLVAGRRYARKVGETRGFKVVYIADAAHFPNVEAPVDTSPIRFDRFDAPAAQFDAGPLLPVVATRRSVMSVPDMLAETDRLKALGVPHSVAVTRAYEKAMGIQTPLQKALHAPTTEAR